MTTLVIWVLFVVIWILYVVVVAGKHVSDIANPKQPAEIAPRLVRPRRRVPSWQIMPWRL